MIPCLQFQYKAKRWRGTKKVPFHPFLKGGIRLDTAKMVKKLAKQKELKLSNKEILLSPEFHNYLTNYIESLLFRIRRKPNLKIEYDTKEGATIAYTDNELIFLNAGNRISSFYESIDSQLLALLGIVTHECCHILYLDFEGEKTVLTALKDGSLTGEFEIEDDISAEIIDFVKDTRFYKLFQQIYHELSNIFSDVHDEGKGSQEFGGIVEKSLLYSAEAMRMKSSPLDKLIERYKEEPLPQLGLQLMYSCILHYARYRELIINDEEAVKKEEFYQKITELMPVIELGRSTDDLYEKYTCINNCIYVLWDYISQMLNSDDTSGSEDGESDSDESGEGTNEADGSGSSSSSENSEKTSKDGKSNSSSGESSSGEISEEKIEEVLNALNEASKDMNSSKAPERDKNTASPKSEKSETSDKSAMDNNTAKDVINNILKQVKKAISEDKAEKEVEETIKEEQNRIIQGIDMTSSHKGRKIRNIRDLDITDSEKQEYNRIMGPLKGISKSMQRQMLAVLRDLKEGDTLKHRTFGSKLEARDTYRLDSKMFSKKKLPQDLPDMVICILVDESGSMKGERIEAAKQATMLLYDFAIGLQIPTMVLGHTEDYYTDKAFVLRRYAEFDTVNDKDKYRLAKIKARENNRDGMALLIASELLSRRPEQVKLLIVISDGQPVAINYSGESARRDMRDILKKYKKKGIKTFAAAIGSDKPMIKSIYGEGYLDISDLSKLPKAIVSLVKKRIV